MGEDGFVGVLRFAQDDGKNMQEQDNLRREQMAAAPFQTAEYLWKASTRTPYWAPVNFTRLWQR